MMRINTRVDHGFCSLVAAILLGATLKPATTHAQLPASVDIDLADNASSDSLQVRVRANGADFSELLTGLTFTIRWPATSPATLGALSLACGTAVPIMPTPALTDGDHQYVTYNAFSTMLIQDECPGQAWLADQWRTLMRVKVDGLDGCTAFNIINDAWTAANNRDYYISLNGVNLTGAIEATPDSVGSCLPDCLGIPGGANLPGTLCDDGDACTIADLWSAACLCSGTYTDSDSDGTCDANDGCPDDPNKIDPGLCGCGTPETDTDGDATPDCNDGCPLDPLKLDPGTCGCGVPDTDTDGDLIADCQDGCPEDPLKVTAGYCGCGTPETDGDGDALPDCVDGCPEDPLKTEPGICGCGIADVDGDGDGSEDCIDGCPNDPGKTLPGVCGCGIADIDGDGDGSADCVDGCPADPDKTAPGVCGCGVPDTDGDGDSTPDCNDGCPNDPNKVAPGDCGCGAPEPGALCDDDDIQTTNDQIQSDCLCAGALVDCNDSDTCTVDSFDGLACVNAPLSDTDGDGACDLIDGCPDDPNKLEPGLCGCGVSDADSDGDAVPDCSDACPLDPLKLAPGICGCGVPDDDSDADGFADCVDGCPQDPDKSEPGICGCGVPDTDTDGDGVADCTDDCPAVAGEIGSPCDDGNSATTDDALNDQCVCIGFPGNDPCFFATEIPVWPALDCPANSTAGDNANATPDAGNTLCDLDGFLNDVWYLFNSGDNEDVLIDLEPGTMTAWGIGVYAECGGPDLYCASGSSEPFAFNTQPNTPYLIRIYTPAWFGQGGVHGICVSELDDVAISGPVQPVWSLFPNPAENVVFLTNGGGAADATIEWLDATGRAIRTYATFMNRGSTFAMDHLDLTDGLYVVRVTTDGRRWEQRLVMR